MNGVSEPVAIGNIKKEPLDTLERCDEQNQDNLNNYRHHLIGPFAVNESSYNEEREKSKMSDTDILSVRIASRDGADSITSQESEKIAFSDEIGGELKYECQICTAKFRSARAFRGHTNAHRYSSEGQSASFLPCSPYSGQFSPKAEQPQLQTSGTFKCDGCKKLFYSRDTYAMHMMLRAKNDNCSLSKATLSQINLDLKEEKSERVKMNIEAILSSLGHSAWNPMDMHKVPLRKPFDYRSSKELPRPKQGTSDTLACSVCGEVMHSKDSLAMHMLFHARGEGNEEIQLKPLPLPPLALPTMRDYANALALAGNKLQAARNIAAFHQAAVNLTDNMSYFDTRATDPHVPSKNVFESHSLIKGAPTNDAEHRTEISKLQVSMDIHQGMPPITPPLVHKDLRIGNNDSRVSSYSSDIEETKSDTAVEFAREDSDTPMDLVLNKAEEARPRSLDGGMKNPRIPEKRYHGKYKNYHRLKMRRLIRKYSKQNFARRQQILHSKVDESTAMIKQPAESPPIIESNPNIPKELLASRSISCYCQYCEIIYLDRTIYQLHMGLHNVNNPWQCNACGKVCENRLEFSSHVLHY